MADPGFFDEMDRQLRELGPEREQPPDRPSRAPYSDVEIGGRAPLSDRPASDAITRVLPGRPSPLAILRELSEVLGTRTLDRQQLLETLLDGAILLTGAERGLMVLREEGEELSIELARGQGRQALDVDGFEYSHTIIERTLESGETVHVPQTALDAHLGATESVTRLKLHSIMCAPLRLRVRRHRRPGHTERRRLRRSGGGGIHRVLGAIYLDSAVGDYQFSGADLGVFETLANHATSVLAHSRYFDEATTDRLTGLVNRRQLGALLADERQISRGSEGGFVYAVLDLDGFRTFNERAGYRKGDELLREVARVLERSLRRIDIVCRYGADKFGVLLPETDADGAARLLSRVRDALKEAGVPLTFSAGMALWSGEAPDISGADLMARADQALWAAKHARLPSQLWEPGLARGAQRADKLAGILTGDWATDYRNVLALLEALHSLGGEQRIDALVTAAVDHAVRLVGADRGLLLLAEPPPGMPEVHARGPDRAPRQPDALDEGLARQALGERRSLRVDEADRVARMAAPLTAHDQLLGALLVARSAEQPFDPNEATFFRALVREVSTALESARLAELARAHGRQIEALNKRLAAKVEQTTAELAEAKRALGQRYSYEKLVGRSPAMRRVFDVLDKVSASSLPVLIQGESGTGKEVVARAIHHNGDRADQIFLSENCAALSPTLLESELFGHVKGSFTGATADRVGLFERADGGTLFLDEVGDLGLELQAPLLRALEQGEIRPVGGHDVRKVDVRIVAASNKDLQELCREGQFREDLYYRLAVVTVELPALRERLDDLPLLVDALLAEADAPVRLDAAAHRVLAAHEWPGNVRELRNVLDKLVLFADGPIVTAEEVDRALGRTTGITGELPLAITDAPFKEAKRAFERMYLKRALREHNGNISRTASEIGVDRRYLYDLLDKHELRQRNRGAASSEE